MQKCGKFRKFNEVEVKIESGQGDDETVFSQSEYFWVKISFENKSQEH